MAAEESSEIIGTLRIPPTERGYRQYRLSARQYLAIIDAGIFPPETQLELVGGVPVHQIYQGQPHRCSLEALAGQLRTMLPAHRFLRESEPIRLGPCTRLVPDIVIAHGPSSRYHDRVPHAKDVELIVEISEFSYIYDRGEKWRRYASAGIPAYWIVNIPERRVESYQRPSGGATVAAYVSTRVLNEEAIMPVIIDGVEIGRIVVKDILP